MKTKIVLFGCLVLLASISPLSAQQLALSAAEQEVYNKHQAEIDFASKIAVEDQMMYYIKKYIIPRNYYDAIRVSVVEQELRLCICNYIFPDNALDRYKAKKKIKSEYGGAISKQLLLAGAYITTDNYFWTLVLRDKLKLTTTQTDTIVGRAIQLNDYLEKHPKYNTWQHELKTFSTVFNQQQMDNFLIFKNRKKVEYMWDTVWKTLKNHNMTNDLDSVRVMNQVKAHYNNVYKAEDLYAQNDSVKKEAVDAVWQIQPLAVKRYYQLRRQDKAKGNSASKNSYKGNLVW
ncbi:MAG: hypothetical protein ACK5L7_07325 [Paludibacteraceae bacterium]